MRHLVTIIIFQRQHGGVADMWLSFDDVTLFYSRIFFGPTYPANDIAKFIRDTIYLSRARFVHMTATRITTMLHS